MTVQVGEKKKMGRRPYADPMRKKHKIISYPTLYEINLLGGEIALRSDIQAYIEKRVKEKEAEKLVE